MVSELLSRAECVVFDNIANRVIQEDGTPSPDDLDEGKAYMQRLYWDFNSR